MEPGSIVMVHLQNPTEKYWGLLQKLDAPGVTMRCINIASFDDWTRSIAVDGPTGLGLVTIFFPLTRVERIFLDERVGEIESMSEMFERQVGRPVGDFLAPPQAT